MSNNLRPQQLVILPVAAVMLAIVASMTAVFGAGDFELGAGGLEISGAESITLAGMVPGDSSSVSLVELHATEATFYTARLEWEGSAQLAAELEITITADDGTVLHSGTLSETEAQMATNRYLAEGEADGIAIQAHLPLTAGNGVQGAAVAVTVMIDAVGAGA